MSLNPCSALNWLHLVASGAPVWVGHLPGALLHDEGGPLVQTHRVRAVLLRSIIPPPVWTQTQFDYLSSSISTVGFYINLMNTVKLPGWFSDTLQYEFLWYSPLRCQLNSWLKGQKSAISTAPPKDDSWSGETSGIWSKYWPKTKHSDSSVSAQW